MSDIQARLIDLSPAKRALLEKLLLEKSGDNVAETIPPQKSGAATSLSHAEKRLWFVDRLQREDPFYNMPLAARLTGALDRHALAKAVAAVVARHDALRTTYHLVDGDPQRVVHEAMTIAPEWVDFTESDKTQEQVNQQLRSAARETFDLETGPLLRIRVYQTGPQEHIMLLVMHHIVSDGWSMIVMLRELTIAYDAFCQQQEPTLPTLPIQYADFAHWQNERSDDDTIAQQLSFWKNQLADAPGVLDLPTDRPRPAVQDFVGKTAAMEFSTELTAAVNQLARQRKTTPFVVLLAAEALLLGRYSRQDDLVLGTASAGRSRAETESLIGFFVNTLPLRVSLNESLSFGELIDQVHATVLAADENADVPFEQLVSQIAAGRDRSYSPIFQASMVLQNLPRDFGSGKSIAVRPLSIDNGTAKFDLTFFLWQEDARLTGHVEYRTTLFNHSTIVRLVDAYQTLLNAATNDPDAGIASLPLLSDAEQNRLVQEVCSGRDTSADAADQPKLMHHLFQRHVADRKDNLAVIHNDQSITYAELDQRSDQIAAALVKRGVASESAVVVALPRSIELITSFLAILKAGGAYVPVDPSYPEKRIASICTDTDAVMVINEASFDELLRESQTLIFDPPSIKPTDLAYIIFTSGSTGAAKGVQIEHRSIVNFILAQIDRMGVLADDRIAQNFSPAFDGATSEIFMTIGSGATSVINDADVLSDPQWTASHFRKHRITVAKFAPALLAMLDPSQFDDLRVVASAGDKLTGELASRWTVSERRFFNGYGPTEVSVGCCMMDVTQDDATRPPIGPPMNNMRIYVLDLNRQMVPIGAKGEIYIGGPGVARGYLNQPELTNDVFLSDPFAGGSGRMYRTGDLGRWRSDGMLEFIGRADNQISLRGFRIEPGEIAAALETCQEVRQAVVTQRNDDEQSQLVAYIVPEKERSAVGDALESQHVTGWSDLFQQAHRTAPVILNPDFNITGWVSTYTNKPIPEVEMKQWADSAIDRILSLNPTNVLEIGCGTGLLLLQIAEHCQSYVGTDLLRSSLENIELALRKRSAIADKVSLHQQLADQFDAVAGQKFDTIVLNSVVQYFPSVDYFLRVLHGAINHLAPGGSIFLGDIRNFRLQEQLATSIELFNSADDLSIDRLKNQILVRIEHEEELLLAPSLFQKFTASNQRLKSARVLLKNTSVMNELTHYRYDVILTADDAPKPTATETTTLGAATQPDELANKLADTPGAVVSIRGITNPRIAQDCRATELLGNDTSIKTAGELRARSVVNHLGPDPNEFAELAIKTEHVIETRWNAENKDCYDVVCVPTTTSSSVTDISHVDDDEFDFSGEANRPLSSRIGRQLTQTLRDQLREQLPAFMLPSAFVVLDALPQTVNGKVDVKALPAPVGRPTWAGDFVAPQNDTQQIIVEIWEDLLDVRPVGIHDDFFDLGGHSMLAVRMIAEIDKSLSRQLPLGALFQEPTVAHLANLIEQGDATGSESTVVTLRKSDTGTPLFCIHPAGGTVFCYLELAKHLSNARPVFGLQAQGIDGHHPPHDTLVEMAAHYADVIRQHAEGPVHIAGWSLGGNIAYEVARQLKCSGHEVGVVALLDSGLLSPETELTEEDFLPLLGALFPGAMNVPLEELRQKDPSEQLQFFVQRAATAGIIPTKEFDRAGNVLGVFQANVKAVHQYVADRYAGDIHLFRPADQAKTSNLFDDPVLGWQQFVENVHTIQVPGDHAHMLQSPAVETLASELDRTMCEIDASQNS